MPQFKVSFFGTSTWKLVDAKSMKEAKIKFAITEGVCNNKEFCDLGYIRAKKQKGGSSYS